MSFAVVAKLISVFVFATLIVQSLYFPNPKFQSFNHLLWLHRRICDGPDRKPNCWFSHAQAQINLRYSRVLSRFTISWWISMGPRSYGSRRTRWAACVSMQSLKSTDLKSTGLLVNHSAGLSLPRKSGFK